MKIAAIVLSFILLVTVIITMPSASAMEEMNGVTMSFSPHETNSGSSVHMVVTLHNANNRSLTITTLTIQIYEGMLGNSDDKYTMYHTNPADAVVPSEGSKKFHFGW